MIWRSFITGSAFFWSMPVYPPAHDAPATRQKRQIVPTRQACAPYSSAPSLWESELTFRDAPYSRKLVLGAIGDVIYAWVVRIAIRSSHHPAIQVHAAQP